MLVPVLANGPADPTDSSVWSADSDGKSVAGGVGDLGGDYPIQVVLVGEFIQR